MGAGRVMLVITLLLFVVVAVAVLGLLGEVGRLSAVPLVSASGAYDYGRANAITHLYLQVIIVLLVGLPGAALAGWLAWRFGRKESGE